MTHSFIIETERLRLVPWTEEDRGDFERLATDPAVLRFISGGIPYGAERIDEFVARQIRQQKALGYSLWRIVLKGSGEFAGFCGLQPLLETGEPEVGWWLAPEHWKKGIATEAARAALDWGFRVCGMPVIVAVAIPENSASIAVMCRIGMRADGETIHRDHRCARYIISREEWC